MKLKTTKAERIAERIAEKIVEKIAERIVEKKARESKLLRLKEAKITT